MNAFPALEGARADMAAAIGKSPPINFDETMPLLFFAPDVNGLSIKRALGRHRNTLTRTLRKLSHARAE